MNGDREKLEQEIRLKIETEHNKREIEELQASINKRWDREDIIWSKLDSRLDRIEAELSLYKTLIKFFKAVALTVAAILAFKFGDIKGIWKP